MEKQIKVPKMKIRGPEDPSDIEGMGYETVWKSTHNCVNGVDKSDLSKAGISFWNKKLASINRMLKEQRDNKSSNCNSHVCLLGHWQTRFLKKGDAETPGVPVAKLVIY